MQGKSALVAIAIISMSTTASAQLAASTESLERANEEQFQLFIPKQTTNNSNPNTTTPPRCLGADNAYIIRNGVVVCGTPPQGVSAYANGNGSHASAAQGAIGVPKQ